MTSAAGAARAGTIGGLAAGLIAIVPALLGSSGDGRIVGYAALLAVLISVQVGARAAALAPAGFAARLAAAALIAVLASALYGLALYLLYAALRPQLLTLRYSAYAAALWTSGLSPERQAAGLAELAARRAQYLDPAYQAVEGAGLALFCGLVLGAYGAFRARVAGRLGPRPG
ncbi:MAG TPA: hypothetical protein VMT92_10370 [Steroidobacteraceae bacterium]|nr:hypothetical protein [Steroidobacteraceae bacterium]